MFGFASAGVSRSRTEGGLPDREMAGLPVAGGGFDAVRTLVPTDLGAAVLATECFRVLDLSLIEGGSEKEAEPAAGDGLRAPRVKHT